MRKPNPQEQYTLSDGKLYQIITLAVFAPSGEDMVVYQELSGDYRILCTRLKDFMADIESIAVPKASMTGAKDNSLYTDSHAEEAKKLNMNPLVVAFLDADSVAARLRILDELRKDVTDEMIDIMALAVDTNIEPADDPYDRYVELREMLATKQRYEESGRLRG